ncbi:MAG: ATP-binding protein [Desulfovibrionaceae bacterium]|nr:ATP-binding protein [Desulfovibrionaceae bacterium]
MSTNDREKVHHELLEALYTARKQVEALEAALAHNAAFLGTGVEREGQIGRDAPDSGALPNALMHYLELVEPEEDISNFIGREGHDESRPRLGKDAPDEVRPDKQPPVSPLVGQLALGHPSDAINFGLPRVPTGNDAQPAPSQTDSPDAADPPPRAGAVCTTVTETPPGGLALYSDDSEGARLIFKAINDGIWDWNAETDELYVSPRWTAITGMPASKEDSPLEALIALLQPVDAANLRRRFFNLMQGECERIQATVRFPRDPGWGWGILRAVALRREGKAARIIALLSDITAQREAEIALHASNEKFRAMAEDSPDVIARIDREGRFLSVSPTISRYFTIRPQDMIGRSLDDFDLSGGRGFFRKSVRNVFATAKPGHSEIMLDLPLTGKALADCRFWPEFGPDRHVVSVSVLIRDITFSQRLAGNYYALFNRMEDGFILFEHISNWEGTEPSYGPDDFALVVLNPAFSRMFKVNSPEITGLKIRDILAEAAEQWAACLRRVLVEERPLHQELHLESGYYEISAYSPESGRVACIVSDITDLRKIERETRLNESRLAALHRLSHMDAACEDAVMRFSLEQAVKLTGSAFGYLCVAGRNESEKGHTYWSKDVAAQEHDSAKNRVTLLPWTENETCREIRHSEVVNAAQGNFADITGESVSVERYAVTPIMDEGRVVCLVGVANKQEPYTSSDLRQLDLFINGMWFHLRRRWAMQTLHKAKEEAEAASRAKNEFLANVSHELRTPLNGMLGMLQVLQQSPLTPEQMECVTTASHSGRSLLRIISDILDFSRIEAGRLELVPQQFNFSVTVRSALGMFTHQAKRKHIDFSLHLDPNIPQLLVGDDARVRQIIFNLVGNAFKFTREGSISVECTLLPRCKKGFRCIYLAVRDTGIGIPDDKLGDIFHAFTQLDSSSTRRFSGTGLGLAIVQRLVKMMNGAVSVESTPGQGTTVHCSLRFAVPDSVEEEKTPPPPPPPSPREARPLKLLVVEDDPVSQLTLRLLLKKAGHDCVCVPDGRQALEALLLQAFDCIITDIQMPVMDGMEMTRRIREGKSADITPSAEAALALGLASWSHRLTIPRDIPIIVLTAYAMAGDKERFLDMGVDYYLAKPVNAAELSALLAQVSTLLDRQESRAPGATP